MDLRNFGKRENIDMTFGSDPRTVFSDSLGIDLSRSKNASELAKKGIKFFALFAPRQVQS